MKTYLTYGFAIGIVSLLLTLALFFLGYHSDVEKVSAANIVSSVGGLAITLVGIILGTRVRRAEIPASEPFGYGRALGAGVLISLFAAIVGVAGYLLYMGFINPDLKELMVQAQTAKLEGQGMGGDQIAAAESVMRMMMHPAMQAVFGLIGGVLYGTIISLITAAFLKRPATDPVLAS